jgi:sugar phosphate isomerase/epimerase
MQKIGVIHYNWPGFSFEEYLRFAAESGYRYVELMVSDVWREGDEQPERSAESVRRQVESHGLRVSALGAGNDFIQPDVASVTAQVDRMKRIAELTKLLDEEAVIRSEGGQPKASVPEERWLDAMHECFARCAEWVDALDVGIAIDNHGLVTNDGDLLFAVIQRVNHPLIGANLDTMNFRWYGHDIATCNRFYEMLAPHALHTHMKDGFDSRANYRGAALGDGEIDLAHALNCLQRANYQGVYTSEYEGPEAAGGVGYRKCAEWLKARIPAG